MPVEMQAVLTRLRMAEADLRAARQMLEEDRPCQQILHQLNAVQSALKASGSQFLCMEVQRCMQTIQDDPCPEERCEDLAQLSSLYPFFSKIKVEVLWDFIEVK